MFWGEVLVVCGFHGIGPIHLSCQIYVHGVVYSIFSTLLMPVVIFSLSILILVICAFFLSLWLAWLGVYKCHCSFQRNSFLFHWFFSLFFNVFLLDMGLFCLNFFSKFILFFSITIFPLYTSSTSTHHPAHPCNHHTDAFVFNYLKVEA